MKLIVGGDHLWRDAALIADILEKCQRSTDETLRIVPAPGNCGSLARRVANRVGYTIVEPPQVVKYAKLPLAALEAYYVALVKAHSDAAMLIVFHDRLMRGSKVTKGTRTRNLTDKAVAAEMDIILVTHQHGCVELN